MSHFDNHPAHFRILVGVIAACLLGLGAFNAYRYAGVPTDENLFRTSPSRLHVFQSFPGQLTTPGGERESWYKLEFVPDSVLAGDLLLACNGRPVEATVQLRSQLEEAAAADTMVLELFRPMLSQRLFYAVARAALPDSFVRPISPSVYIIDVLPGGASDRAGLRRGDLILRINQQGFRDALEADRIMRRAHSGNTIAYHVLRGDRALTTHITLAKLGFSLPLLVSWLSGLLFMGTGLFLAMRRPRLAAARTLGLALVTYSFLLIAAYQRHVEIDLLARLVFFGIAGAALFGTAFMVHNAAHFPQQRPELLRRPWLQRVPYVVATVCLLIIAVLGLQSRAPFFVGMLALLLYAGVVKFLFRKECPPEYKKQRRVLIWNNVLVAVAMIAISVLFVRGGKFDAFGYLGLPLMFIPLALLYTVGRHRLLDMRLRVRRNVQYLLASGLWRLLWWGSLAVMLWLLSHQEIRLPSFRFTGTSLEIIDLPMPPQQSELAARIMMILAAIVLTLLWRRIGKTGRLFLARKFYRSAYDYRRAVNELSEVMATKLSMLDLARGIAGKLVEHVQLKRMGVMFFRDQKMSCCQESYGFDRGEWAAFCTATSSQLLDVLLRFRGESRFSVDYLPYDLREQFLAHGLQHVFPIRFKDKLVGAFLIGEKLSESTFHQDDLNYLTAVARQASLAIENAFLYEELAGQERLKHELAIARRIQLASLPQTTPQVPGLDIAGTSVPAAEVGGDYFDYLNGEPGRITVIVGDVSGKGTSAALYMSKVQGILRSLHDFGLSPRALFIRANHLLRQALERKSFITSIGASFDTTAQDLLLARAGHPPLFHYHADTASVAKITPRGLGLGMDDDGVFAAELEERTLCYRSGDVFVFVTDGITEALRQDGLEFGEERLAETLQRHAARAAQEIRDEILAEVRAFSASREQHDDQTLVVVKAVT